MGDLEAVCEEYRKNFEALELRYQSLTQQLQSEKDKTTRLQGAIQQQQQELQRAGEEKKAAIAETEGMMKYKEKYHHTAVAVEHLKGRLEAARAGVADREREHQHELEQVRQQMADLHKRIEVSADAAFVATLRNQKQELEERCALLNGQLLEAKETASHSQIANNAALRDTNARNLELEQRCRAMEQELASIRAQSRRALELQTEATLIRDRHDLERGRQALESESLKKEVASLRQQLRDQQSAAEHRQAQREAEWAEDRETLMSKLQSATRQLDAALQQRTSDDEKLSQVQRDASSRLAAVREEHQIELDAIQGDKAAAVDETQRLRWRVTTLEQQMEEQRVLVTQAEGRASSAESQRQHLASQLEASVQQESWTAAERDRLQGVAGSLEKQVEEAVAAQRASGETSMELERTRMQLRYAETDMNELRQQLERAASYTTSVEQVYKDKVARLQEQLADSKKTLKKNIAKADRQRKTLTAAMMAKEAEHAAAQQQRGGHHGRGSPMAAAAAAGVLDAETVADFGGALSTDVMTMLRQSTAQAEALSQQVGNLKRH